MMGSLADILIKGDGLFRLFKNVYIIGEETSISGHRFGELIKQTRLDFMEHQKEGYEEGGYVPKPVVEHEGESIIEKKAKEGNIPRGKIISQTTTVGGMSITEETWVPLDEVSLKDISTSDLLDELIKRTEAENE